MKNFNLLFAAFALFALSFMTACSDDSDTDDDDNNTTQDTNIFPEFNGQDGIFAAIQNLSTQTVAGFTTTIVADAAFAGVLESTNDYIDMGDVSVNSNTLTNNSNAYFGASTDVTGTGYGFSTTDNVEWAWTGATGFAGSSYTTTNEMVGEFEVQTDVSTIDLSADLTVTINSVPANATNLLWQIADNDGNIIQQMTTTETSATFPAADLGTLTAGNNSLFQVAAYNAENSTINGKNCYFINESVVTEFVELQ